MIATTCEIQKATFLNDKLCGLYSEHVISQTSCRKKKQNNRIKDHACLQTTFCFENIQKVCGFIDTFGDVRLGIFLRILTDALIEMY